MFDYTHTFLPYLIRAAYDWLVDNHLTPYIEIDTTNPHVVVPKQYIENNRIVLDITPQAVNKLKIDNETVEFSARFDDKISFVTTPLSAIMAIFNPDHGYGIKLHPTINIAIPISAATTNPALTTVKPTALTARQQKTPTKRTNSEKKPTLKIVKRSGTEKGTKKDPE